MSSQSEPDSADNSTLIIGISGPSSSGKTTLARLLKYVFSVLSPDIQSFIIHEDDFYFPDDQIPTVRTATGEVIQDWDTIDAIDIPFLSSSLAYLRKHGSLPPELKSKEDFNQDAGAEVNIDAVEVKWLRKYVKDWPLSRDLSTKTIAFLEGFLLYSPPQANIMGNDIPKHLYSLRTIYQNIHAHLFLPATYDEVKKRREGRSGYATIGPSSTTTSSSSTSLPQRTCDAEEAKLETESGQETPTEKDTPQNFWVDPPGYVDDVVWPNYVRDHSWLLLSENGEPIIHADGVDNAELLRKVGQATNIRTDAGVTVSPCQSIMDTLKWAVPEVLNAWEKREKGS